MLRHLWSRTAAAASASVRIRSAAPTVCGGIASSAAHKLWIARALSTSGAAATTRTVSTALRTTTSASKSIQPVGLPSNWLVPALSTSPFALQQQRRWASADAAATAASAGGNGKQRTNTGGDGGSGSGSGSGGSGQQNSGEDEQKSSRMWDRFLWLRVLWNTYSPNSKQALFIGFFLLMAAALKLVLTAPIADLALNRALLLMNQHQQLRFLLSDPNAKPSTAAAAPATGTALTAQADVIMSGWKMLGTLAEEWDGPKSGPGAVIGPLVHVSVPIQTATGQTGFLKLKYRRSMSGPEPPKYEHIQLDFPALQQTLIYDMSADAFRASAYIDDSTKTKGGVERYMIYAIVLGVPAIGFVVYKRYQSKNKLFLSVRSAVMDNPYLQQMLGGKPITVDKKPTTGKIDENVASFTMEITGPKPEGGGSAQKAVLTIQAARDTSRAAKTLPIHKEWSVNSSLRVDGHNKPVKFKLDLTPKWKQ